MHRCVLGLALLAAMVGAQSPEPGPVPTSILRLKQLEVPRREGDANKALETFLEAHRAHKRGDVAGALRGYLAFSGMHGAAALPARYAATVNARLDALRADLRARYEKALRVYAKDRKKGLARVRGLAEDFPMLPEGSAALALWHTDAIHQAMADARAASGQGRNKEAAAALEKAVRRYTAALYRYEAKRLLVDLGGPDLFDPEERTGSGPEEKREAERKKKKDDEETTIEVGD